MTLLSLFIMSAVILQSHYFLLFISELASVILLDCIVIYQFHNYFILMNFLEIRLMNFLEKRLKRKQHI